MRKYLLICLIFALIGCATTSNNRSSSPTAIAGHEDVGEFCKKNKLHYSFDTIDDRVRIFSDNKEIFLLINSALVYFNGNIFHLKDYPFYSKGKIYIPRELGKIIAGRKEGYFKPSFIIKTIVIDPGHGGKDPGAISVTGYKEKIVNQKVADFLKIELEKRGFKVIMTRDKDEFLTLQQRCDVARKYDADLFVSVHTNSNRHRSVDGLEVYYLSPKSLDTPTRALKLVNESGFWSSALPKDVKTMLWDLLLTKNHSISVEFAHRLYYTFNKLGFKIKPPRKAPYYVLRYAYVPAVLVELGYLSNTSEEKMLKKSHYQRQLAETIATGVVSLNQRYNQMVKVDEK